MRDTADYTLRWPSSIVADEVSALIAQAEDVGVTSDWCEEVERLLKQAFVASVPAEDFEKARTRPAPDPVYGDEEPF